MNKGICPHCEQPLEKVVSGNVVVIHPDIPPKPVGWKPYPGYSPPSDIGTIYSCGNCLKVLAFFDDLDIKEKIELIFRSLNEKN